MTNNANITHDDGTGEAMQGGSGKTFTQEEVNNFIQSRLSRMKAQAAKENEAAFAEREKAIQETRNETSCEGTVKRPRDVYGSGRRDHLHG